METKELAAELFKAIKTYVEGQTLPLLARVKKLEEQAKKAADFRYRGTYKDGTVYLKGNFATYDGSVWACLCDTSTRPGAGNSDWQLAVKGMR